MTGWNSAPMDRRQATLFAPTLDDSIGANHPVRLFEEVLGSFNFDDWESDYCRAVGQPPIHPRVLAGCILYGLSLGIRASRRLEDACINRVDYAPNYTVVLATDSAGGIILDSQVLGGNDEPSTVMRAISNIRESFDAKPTQLLADSGFNTGPNLAELKQQDVQPLMPARQPTDNSAALREDPQHPVAQEKRAALPINPQSKRLDRGAFIYDEKTDCYHCPMGKTLNYKENQKYDHHGTKGIYRVYQCAQCAGCALAAQCLAKTTPQRRICRDEYEKDREEMAQRLKTEAGKKQYSRRALDRSREIRPA